MILNVRQGKRMKIEKYALGSLGTNCYLVEDVYKRQGVNSANGKGAFKYSLEFMGGTSSTVTFDKDYSIEEIDSKIVPVVEEVTGDKNVQFQKVKDSNAVVIKTISLDLEAREAFNKAMADNFGVDAVSYTHLDVYKRQCKKN